ncbi:MAG: serine hydrolase domain-containing protein [Alistipes indistinctus]
MPRFAGTPLTTLTIQELLTHTSGLKPTVVYPDLIKPAHGGKLFNGHRNEQYPYLVDQNLYMVRNVVQDSVYLSGVPRPGYRQIADSLWVNPSVDTIMARKIIRSYDPGRRGRYLYNDTNMYLLRLIAERITGRTLEESTAELFAELGVYRHRIPAVRMDLARAYAAPTENDKLLRRGPIQGFVHDEPAAVSGGRGMPARSRLASDIARFCQMILNNGSYNGRQIITPATIDTFTSSPLSAKGIYRGLGFDKRGTASAFGGPDCCGHTGFTGTIF